DARKMLEEAQPNLTSSQKNVKQTKKDDSLLEKGDDIKHLTINQEGTVLEQTGKNEYLVKVGMIKIKTKINDIERVNKIQNKHEKKKKKQTINKNKKKKKKKKNSIHKK